MIDKAKIQELRPRMEQVLREFRATDGLEAKVGNAKYTPDGTSVTFQVTLSVIDASGQAVTPEREMYKRYASMYGLPVDGLDKTFTAETGIVYRIDGLNLRKSKFPVLATRVADGTRFKFPIQTIQRARLS